MKKLINLSSLFILTFFTFSCSDVINNNDLVKKESVQTDNPYTQYTTYSLEGMISQSYKATWKLLLHDGYSIIGYQNGAWTDFYTENYANSSFQLYSYFEWDINGSSNDAAIYEIKTYGEEDNIVFTYYLMGNTNNPGHNSATVYPTLNIGTHYQLRMSTGYFDSGGNFISKKKNM